MTKLIYPELSYKICGYLFYVHNNLGRFRKEKEYADAVEIVFEENGLKFERESMIKNNFLNKKLNFYKLDFLIDNRLILEIKSKPAIEKSDYYQLKKYLESKKLKLGLLVNFRDKYLKPHRVLNSSNL